MWLTGRNLALAASCFSVRLPRSRFTVRHSWIQSRPGFTKSPLATTDRTLQDSLNRISRGSALWRDAIAAIGKAGRQVLVATPADVVVKDSRGRNVFDVGVLAEASRSSPKIPRCPSWSSW